MVKTGASITIVLPLVVMLLSLLPVGILFIRKVSANKILNVMSLLCLFFFFRHLTVYYVLPNTPLITIGLQLVEFTIVFYLIRLMIQSAQIKYLLNMVLVSFLSVIITIYTIKDVQTYSSAIYSIQSIIIALLAIVALLEMINNSQLILAIEPAFWIACGLAIPHRLKPGWKKKWFYLQRLFLD
jgi:hypothetical protein